MEPETMTIREHLEVVKPYVGRLRVAQRVFFTPLFLLTLAISFITNLPDTQLLQPVWRYSTLALWLVIALMVWTDLLIMQPYILPGLSSGEQRTLRGWHILTIPALAAWSALYVIVSAWVDGLVLALDVHLRLVQLCWFTTTVLIITTLIFLVGKVKLFSATARNIVFIALLIAVITSLSPTWLLAAGVYFGIVVLYGRTERWLENLLKRGAGSASPKEIQWEQ